MTPNRNLVRIVAAFYVVLFLFSSFVLLFEFVIPHGGYYVEDPVITTTTTTITSNTDTTISGDQTGETTTSASPLSYPGEVPSVLATGDLLDIYENGNALISLYHIRAHNSDVYVADVVVTSPYEILAGLAYNIFGGTNYVQAVSTMAENHDAIFAINSDYASHYETGLVIRNGQILRSTISYRTFVALMDDGTVSILPESSTTAQSMLDQGAWQLWSFGPALIVDNVSVADVNDGLDRDRVNNPRSAFGYVGPNHFMFVCVDGRTTESHGVDIEELAEIMGLLNCSQAYNFDGGGSATMYFNGEIVNHPSEGTERLVGDCVYIRA